MADNNERTPLLKVEHLSKEFPAESGMFAKRFSKRVVSAVNDISFEIYPGETFGLVGESGCGKSTTGLTKPTAGKVFFQGKDVAEMSKHEIKDMRREMQFIFQDPYASLNPRMTIGEIIAEPLRTYHPKMSRQEVRERVKAMMLKVGLLPNLINRYPHEFSGGQCQRIGIARALILEPKLIICDEPVSALDVSIQSQILNMLTSLQREMNLSLLFISHDIGVVRYISSRIGVMYLGTLVEEAGTDELFSHPLHPYTQALFASIPDFNKKRTVSLKGELPMYTDEFKGCVFHTRCPYTCDQCRRSAPELEEIYPGHRVACHRMGGIAMK
mgnify:CR=1 FL=1